MVVRGCDDVICDRGDGGSTLLLRYGLLNDKLVQLEVLRGVVSGLSLLVDVI